MVGLIAGEAISCIHHVKFGLSKIQNSLASQNGLICWEFQEMSIKLLNTEVYFYLIKRNQSKLHIRFQETKQSPSSECHSSTAI